MNPPDWLSPVADAASLAGLVVSAGIGYFTRSIAERVRVKIRIPQVRRALQENAVSLSENMAEWPRSKQKTIEAISRAEAILQNVKIKLSRNEKVKVLAVLKNMRGRRVQLYGKASLQHSSEEDFWKIYYGLVGVISSLEQLEKDSRLE